MSDSHLDLKLLKEVECPVCLEYMTSPIKMCENGHNICNSCRSRVSACPTCKGKFNDVRNISLESIAAAIIYPCRNRQSGCTEIFTLDGRTKHQLECLYESRECPFRKLSDGYCRWSGTLSDIAAHVRREHSSETTEEVGLFNVKLLDISRDSRYGHALLISGELFYLAWETAAEAFSFAVFHFGRKNESEVFKYSIKIGNSEEYVAMRRKCHSYLEGGLKDLQPEKCVTLHYGTIPQYFSENGHLSCEIEIGIEMLNGFTLADMQQDLPVVSLVDSKIHRARPFSLVIRAPVLTYDRLMAEISRFVSDRNPSVIPHS